MAVLQKMLAHAFAIDMIFQNHGIDSACHIKLIRMANISFQVASTFCKNSCFLGI